VSSILIVEDSPDNMKLFSTLLRLKGHEVNGLLGGDELFTTLAGGQPDLILMDIQMPGIDGVEATRRIRALGGPAATTPVIALTANVLNHQRDIYLTAGMDGMVGKPISPAALLAEIARLASGESTNGVAALAT